MKLRIPVSLIPGFVSVALAGGSASGATSPGLETARIVWSAPTNKWPDALWIYKVVPQEFPQAAISNMMALARFTSKDQTNMLDHPPFKDGSILYFRNADQSRHLGIFPALGLTDYNDGAAASSSQLQPVVGVPDEPETIRLGLKYLRLIGIDISQIATKANGEFDLHLERGTIGYFPEGTNAEIMLTNEQAVLFIRKIDGIKVAGIGLHGGARVRFGNNSKLADLQVCWRNLKPYELRPFPSLQQVEGALRRGEIQLHPTRAGPDPGRLPKKLRKLTIVEATPLYDGKFYDEQMSFVAPYGRFEAIAEDDSGEARVWFETPVPLN